MSSLKKRPRRSLLDSDDEESEDLFGDPPPHPKVARSQTIEGLSPKSEFLSSLTSSGLELDASRDFEVPHSLECEQALFKKKLDQSFRSNSDLQEKFMDQCKSYLDVSNEVLLKALMPVKATSDSNQEPESLIRILLNIESLQPELSSFLLEKLAMIALEHEDQPARNSDDPISSIPKLILNSLRWLNVTKNGDILTEKLLEILDATPDPVQIEIISSLPEIIPDHFHDKVAGELKKEARLKKKHLTATILDTFTNLSLKPEMSLILRSNVLESIKDAPKEDLPIMVKFVVSCTTSNEAIIEIDTLRENLSLEKESELLSQRLKKKPSKNDDFDVLVIDVIRVAMTSEVSLKLAY